MNVFRFVLGLYSIVAGIGISSVVRGIGQMIEARDRVRPYAVHACFVGVVFVAQIVAWFTLWRFSGHAPWTVIQALLLLLVPILLYLANYLLMPEIDAERSCDLRAHYFRNARLVQGLLVAVAASWVLGKRYIDGQFDLSQQNLICAAFTLILMPGLLTRNPVVHGLQAGALVILMAIGVSYVSLPIL